MKIITKKLGEKYHKKKGVVKVMTAVKDGSVEGARVRVKLSWY